MCVSAVNDNVTGAQMSQYRQSVFESLQDYLKSKRMLGVFLYSGTPLIQTPMEQPKVSVLVSMQELSSGKRKFSLIKGVVIVHA